MARALERKIKFAGSVACLAVTIVPPVIGVIGIESGKTAERVRRDQGENGGALGIGRDTRQLAEYHQSINFYQVSEKAY